MKNVYKITPMILLGISFAIIISGYCHSATVNAESCSLAHVQAAVDSANRGDTVSVPAGACTWTDHLLVTKAISLQGSGKTEDANGTRITIANTTVWRSPYISDSGADCGLNMGDSGSNNPEGIIFWIQNGTEDADTLLEIKNFVFYQSLSVPRITVFFILNGDPYHPLTRVKIHDNLLRLRQDSEASSWTHALSTVGYVWGVFYKNKMYVRKPVISISGNSLDDGNDDGYCAFYAGKHTWLNHTFTPGTQDIMVIEDNEWYFNFTTPTHMGGTGKGGKGMVIRYNSYYNEDPWAMVQSGHDAHGSYTGGYSPLGLEIYGNYWQGTSGCYVGNSLSQCVYSGYYKDFTVIMAHTRAGRNMIWNNYARNLGSDNSLGLGLWLKRACDECVTDFGIVALYTCPSTTTMSGCIGKKRCTADGQPYYISDTYIYQNRLGEAGTSLGGAGTATSVSSEELATCYSPSTTMPRENTEWWRDNADCTSSSCTSGIGCGPTPPTGTCTKGVGYWVTNQSCSTLTTANVGATTDGNFAAKRRDGTLYRCVSTNVWEPYYTPLAYPHPLRTEESDIDIDPPQYVSGTSAPSSPSGSPVTCTTDPQDQPIGFTVTENSGSTVYCRYCDETEAVDYVFPLKVNAAGYLEDQNDIPFFIQGDSPWFSMIKGTQEIITQYLDDRQARGFNALIMDLIEDDAGGPVNAYGEVPFTTPGNFSTSNMSTNAYWTHADWIINQAAARGMVVFLVPAYLGSSDANGFRDELTADTEEHIEAYGTAVGDRYKTFPNIVWVMGGDNDAGILGLTSKHNALAAAIKAADANHIMTAHTKEGYDALNDYDETWLDLNTVYISDWEGKTCNTGTAEEIKIGGYDKLETMPFVFFEGLYENTTTPASGATDLCTRSQAYWGVLGGSPGYFFGNYPLYAFATGWSTAMADDGSRAMTYMGALMRSRDWELLVPDYAHEVVTYGYGNLSDATYVSSARTSDGKTIMAYIPSARTITVDMTKITDAGGKVSAWWYNPATGVASYISEYANTGSRTFTSASGDWVLVLDSEAAGLGVPGASVGSVCNTNTTYAHMPEANTFTNTNLVQTATISDQPCSASYLYYARCIDPTGNESDTIVISYNVDTSDDSDPPEITVFRLDSNGRDLYLTADEPVKVGTGGSGGFVLTKNGTDTVDLTFGSIVDKTIRYQTAIPILSTDTLAIVYTQPTAGIQDLSENDLENIGSTPVVNDSTKGNEASTTLFDHGSVPTYEMASSPNAVNLGVRFQSTEIGTLDEICFYKDASMDGETHIGTVYDSTGAVLGTLTFTSETSSGWQCENLSSPIGILNGVNYTVAILFPSKYIYTRNFFTTAYTNSDEILSASDFNGRYVYSPSSTYPTNVASFRPNYWIDFVMTYQDEGGPWKVDISKTGTGCSYVPLVNQVVEDGGSSTVTVTIMNGWKASFSGCGSGSTVQNGNEYTYTTAAITEDCTVEVTCSERTSPLWTTP